MIVLITNNQLYILFLKNQMKRKMKTQVISNQELDKMILFAADQKLLPQILWDFAKRNKSNHLIKNYQKEVKRIYTEETAEPLKYNPEEARSHRQKFREKVLKLLAHQLPIDYLKPATVNNQTVMTYKGKKLEEIQYPTKKQYKMFREFSETNFKKGFNHIFDDKLEYQHKKIFQSVKKKKKSHTSVFPLNQKKQKFSYQNSPITNDSITNTNQKRIEDFILPKLVVRQNLTEKSRLASSPSTFRQKKIKRITTKDEDVAILDKMKKIGGYSNSTPQEKLSLTKESIMKYLKQYYHKPNRIVDFLNISAVESYQMFRRIAQKLKLMQNQHMFFMIFLFYDSNNDGYICNQDLLKLSEMGKKCPLIEQDCRILRNKAHKVKYQDDLPYKQLYKVPELTETKYFNWSKKYQNQEHQQPSQQKIEIKKYFGQLNRKSVLIHFEGFKKIYGNQKPFLWYDVMWRLCGITYEGLQYT